MADYSDFIIYADESGDHGLVSIDPEYPVFSLALCAVRKVDYVETIVPEIQRFKFAFWGHEAVVLHENDIRRNNGHFAILRTDPILRTGFFDRLNGLLEATPMSIFASAINKLCLNEKYENPQNPYDIALQFCMHQLLNMLLREGQAGKKVHVIFESRGRNEDRDLCREFHRICRNERNQSSNTADYSQVDFELIFQPKSSNSTGLQLADLIVRPIALQVLRPGQNNRAYEIIRPKLEGIRHFP